MITHGKGSEATPTLCGAPLDAESVLADGAKPTCLICRGLLGLVGSVQRDVRREAALNRTRVIYGLSILAEAATVEKLQWLVGGLPDAGDAEDSLSAISEMLRLIGQELRVQGAAGLAHLPRRKIVSRLDMTSVEIPGKAKP